MPFPTTRRLLLPALFAVVVAWRLLTPAPNEAWFGGDSWEYHSMGVNFAAGHGLVAGLREPLERYRFSPDEQTPARLAHFAETGRDPRPYHTYRTPAYPLFLGILYTLCGPQPALAYKAQEILLIAVAFALPSAGRRIHGRAGFCAGLFAGVWFLATSLDMGRALMTEPLIVVHLFVCFLAFHAAERRRSPGRLALWGLAAGLAPLVKGSLLFLPLLAILREAIRFLRQPAARGWSTTVLPFAMALPLVLWSAWISRIEGRPVFLSTQGNAVLLEGNNELCLPDGAWHPEYAADRAFWIRSDRDVSSLYYNQPEVSARPVSRQLLGFFALHWQEAPRLFLNKFNRAFERFAPFKALVLMFLWLTLCAWARLSRGATRPRLTALALLLLGGYGLRWIHPSFAEIGVWTATAALSGLALWLARRPAPPLEPFAMLVFLNFTIITLMTFGLRRFVQVMDPFLLYAAGLLAVQTLSPTFLPCVKAPDAEASP